jgi:hypothetical protein
MPPHSTHSPINVICCADGISRSFAPIHSALGPRHPPPHDACCPLHSPQLNADNVTKPLAVHLIQPGANGGQWICGEGGKLRAGAKRRPHRFKPEAAAGANDETLVMDPTISIRNFRMWH